MQTLQKATPMYQAGRSPRELTPEEVEHLRRFAETFRFPEDVSRDLEDENQAREIVVAGHY